MEEKLDAICDAIDFIKLAKQEIEKYVSLSDIVDELDDIKSELLEKYNEVKESISNKLDYEY